MYSVTSRTSFTNVEILRQSLVRVKRPKHPTFILVGNQNDRINEREVTKQEGANKARAFGCPFFETSAKTAINVEKTFTTVVKLLQTPTWEDSESNETAGSSRDRNGCKWCIIC